jgi:DNA polymerase-3 subunit alpha
MTNFVHLHVHSDFSLTDASATLVGLADKAEQLGMTHLALTDHGNMFGAMEFLAACKETVNEKGDHEDRKNPIKPIIGCEVYVSPGSRFDKKGSENENRYYHLVLLAANRDGYFNLVKLCSLAYTEGFYYRPRIDEELLEKHHKGLIALSACVSGEIPKLIQAGKTGEAHKKAEYYRDLFGKDKQGQPNFYIEIQDHGIPEGWLRGTEFSQKQINSALVDIAKKTGIPLVATNDVHYIEQNDYVAHDVLLCIGTAKNRVDERRKKYYGDQFYFKTGDEMAALFPGYPEAIENTVRIAERCNAEVPQFSAKELPDHLPEFKIPDSFTSGHEYLKSLAYSGLEKRYPKEKADNGNEWKAIYDRASYELDTIINMNFSGYFLIVADFINWAKERGISVGPGRGSGAGSIVAYAMRITDVNPLKYNLLFERFLNPDRISMPDFDIDFANDGRDEVINYVNDKYGSDKVGQIITFGTLGAKQVIKDVARVLGISIAESDMLTKLIGREVTLKRAFEKEPRLREMEQDARFTELFTLAGKLEGLHRHSSIHAAGIVIGKKPLDEIVPLYKEPDEKGRQGGIATQFSMNFLEQCGLVKMDFLGLKTLDVIRHTEELIRMRGGDNLNFNIEDVNENDEMTFKMLSEGKSFEVFQFESDGMQNIIKQTKPNSIDDLIALNAMYRPGPMQFIPRFIDCKNGKQKITYPDKSLEKVLRETYGVIVYQEQVMEVARVVAGYSMGQADLLRRAMGKKKKEVLEKEEIPFIQGAEKRGYKRTKAKEIFDILVPFAEYGFNKSHATAYAIIAYRTAWLKAHFPAEFMAANLSNEINSTDNKLSVCIDETRRMGIVINPPDINESDKLFTVVDGRIVYGFLGIKGLGETSVEKIINERKDEPYRGFMDFLNRVDIKAVGKKSIELLVQTGAFDSFGITRETLAGNLERALEYMQGRKEDQQLGQSNLFDDDKESDFNSFNFENYNSISKTEKLKLEKQLIGFYFSGHPLDDYRDIWEKTSKMADLSNVPGIKQGNYVLVGLIKSVKTIISKSGGKMAFATLGDFNGEIEVTFFKDAWERCERYVDEDKVVILQGRLDYQKDKDRYSFIAENTLTRNNFETALKEADDSNRKNDSMRDTWLYMADLKSSYVNTVVSGNYTAIGVLKSLRDFTDKNGNAMAFGKLHDFEGDIDLVFFFRTYEKYRDFLKLDDSFALRGSIDRENERDPNKISFKVSSIADMAVLKQAALKKVSAGEDPPQPSLVQVKPPQSEMHIRIKAEVREDTLETLRNILSDNSGPDPVLLHIPVNNTEKIIRAANGISLYNYLIIEGQLKNSGSVTEVWRI